jgi:hypothetical protein
MKYSFSAASKAPPQPLPTRGRGSTQRLRSPKQMLAIFRYKGSGLSPSPLWGGVGEGFSFIEGKTP